jgi:hypothetical protein
MIHPLFFINHIQQREERRLHGRVVYATEAAHMRSVESVGLWYRGTGPVLIVIGLATVFISVGTFVFIENRKHRIELSEINAQILRIESHKDLMGR